MSDKYINDGSNPFLALFGLPSPIAETSSSFNDLAEQVFLFSLHPNKSKNGSKLCHLTDLATILHPKTLFDQPVLEQALMEFCINTKQLVINYLFECYERLQYVKHSPPEEVEFVKTTILHQAHLALSEPYFFQGQDLDQQLIELFSNSFQNSNLKTFFDSLLEFCATANKDLDPSIPLFKVFSGTFLKLQESFKKQDVLTGRFPELDFLQLMCLNPLGAKTVINNSFTSETAHGREYENTLLGCIFTSSCIPSQHNTFNYFENPSHTPVSVHNSMESNLWAATERMHSRIYNIIYTLLKSTPDVHNLCRKWLGQVLFKNKARGQTWAQHHSGALKANCVSDAFMLNFGAVLLKLCQPICLPDNPKALEKLAKVDPTYCATPIDKVCDEEGIHLPDMFKETCLLATQEGETRTFNGPFSFLSEIFYLTHRALELGVKGIHQEFVQLNQDLSRIERAYRDAQNQSGPEVLEPMRQRMDLMMSSYLSIKAAMLVPEALQLNTNLMLATSRWLCSVALGIRPSETASLSAAAAAKDEPNKLLSSVPEFCLSNVIDHVVFLYRFSPTSMEGAAGPYLDHFLTMIVTFMGSPSRLKNPHMRAALAEMLDALMPRQDKTNSNIPTSTYYREKLFNSHPQYKKVVATLLNVFVSIEMTGQGVAFEQKFNYRRPMYAVMKYLWTIKSHRQQFKALALEAEANMDAAQPPLFLQFINLLINDAIYLLDEALSYMAQLKELQQQRGEGAWPDIPALQRNQRESSYQHISMLARFHNMMGRETIQILEMLTKEISAVFVHPTMVDRVASMLNYFLLHLVGPKKRDFKVKDFKEYEFEPANLVSHICEIYSHLSPVDAFCYAVSQDGRSYSPQLFIQAEAVLSRISRGGLIGDLQEVARRVAEYASQQKSDEELVANAPEEFLDPIMSTIMMNPVILPSSRQVVDRSTIARHLLSDQSDPFNRSPLTMEDIKPDEELKARIQQWLQSVVKTV